jgi:hypothetical protein
VSEEGRWFPFVVTAGATAIVMLFLFLLFVAATEGIAWSRPWPDVPSELVKTPGGGKIDYTSGDTEDSKQPWCFVVRKVTFDSKGAEGESGNGSMVFARTCEELALDWMKEGK